MLRLASPTLACVCISACRALSTAQRKYQQVQFYSMPLRSVRRTRGREKNHPADYPDIDTRRLSWLRRDQRQFGIETYSFMQRSDSLLANVEAEHPYVQSSGFYGDVDAIFTSYFFIENFTRG